MSDNKLSTVAIVGRPNVGKSTLFNRLLSKPVAIAHEESGVTRDRKYHELEWNGKRFLLADTGGITPSVSDEKFSSYIRNQAETAIDESELVLFLVDAHVGITDEDLWIASRLRRHQKKVLLVANKVDTPVLENSLYEFLKLGFGDAFPISAIHGRNSGDLLDDVASRIQVSGGNDNETVDVIRLAIIGKPNVGKSTLTNRLLGKERMITDSSPGTTRDSVDSTLDWNGRRFVLIDTAGLRKRTHVREPIEQMSSLRTQESMERCDIALVIVEAAPLIEEQDVKIIQKAWELGKGVIVGMNKWDLKEKETKTFDEIAKRLRERYPVLNYIPIFSLSAKTGQRAVRALELAEMVHMNFCKSFAPQDFREFLLEVSERHHHPSLQGRRIAFSSMTLVSRIPLVFDVRTNRPKDVRDAYIKYLEKQFYKRFETIGVPVRFNFIKKSR